MGKNKPLFNAQCFV